MWMGDVDAASEGDILPASTASQHIFASPLGGPLRGAFCTLAFHERFIRRAALSRARCSFIGGARSGLRGREALWRRRLHLSRCPLGRLRVLSSPRWFTAGFFLALLRYWPLRLSFQAHVFVLSKLKDGVTRSGRVRACLPPSRLRCPPVKRGSASKREGLI
jgi:hypothetical protein